jgi:hypothetical protein
VHPPRQNPRYAPAHVNIYIYVDVNVDKPK